METTPQNLLGYFRSLSDESPADTPREFIASLSHGSEAVATGFQQLWNAMHMRRYMNNNFTGPERRCIESDIAERMASLDRSDERQAREWLDLHCIHLWSVTADMAELAINGFMQTKP